jgi:hypothetical protein
MIGVVPDEDNDRSFEQLLRSLADELGRSVERALDSLDVEGAARSVGFDPEQAREWIEAADRWLQTQLEGLRDDFGQGAAAVQRALTPADQTAGAIPDALDLPNDQQGSALAALSSGRWIIDPDTDMLVVSGDGPGPGDALGTALELRVRDWITVDGQLTIAGRHALERWLDAASQR